MKFEHGNASKRGGVATSLIGIFVLGKGARGFGETTSPSRTFIDKVLSIFMKRSRNLCFTSSHRFQLFIRRSTPATRSSLFLRPASSFARSCNKSQRVCANNNRAYSRNLEIAASISPLISSSPFSFLSPSLDPPPSHPPLCYMPFGPISPFLSSRRSRVRLLAAHRSC